MLSEEWLRAIQADRKREIAGGPASPGGARRWPPAGPPPDAGSATVSRSGRRRVRGGAQTGPAATDLSA